MIYNQLIKDKEKEINECIKEMEIKKGIALQQIRNQLDDSTRFDSEDEEKDIIELNNILTKKPSKKEGKYKIKLQMPKKIMSKDLGNFLIYNYRKNSRKA